MQDCSFAFSDFQNAAYNCLASARMPSEQDLDTVAA